MSVLGTALLVCIAVVSMYGVVAWLWAANRSSHTAARWGSGCTVLAAGAAALAAIIVWVALWRHDTRLGYVATVSAEDLAAYYRLTALWSALEGSLLLWLLVLSAVTLLALRYTSDLDLTTRRITQAVLCALVAAFALVTLTASPFTVSAETSSRPSPLLQDHPAMGVHPPALYVGFLALAVPYALTIGALATGRLSAAWGESVRRWTLFGWIFLTAGIALGGWWSYAVLGWGGYWAWDPVENAALMPWLLATALIHASGPRRRGLQWRSWTAALASASFVLVLFATFLTRSGLVESVHAFSTSPLGPVLLTIVVCAAVPWIILTVLRRDVLREPQKQQARLWSRAAALYANHLVLVLVTLMVLIGTILPAVLLATAGQQVSVGPPWYHRVLAPLALVLLVAMAMGPWLTMRGDSSREAARQLRPVGLVAAICAGAMGFVVPDPWIVVVCALTVLVGGRLAVDLMGPRRRNRGSLGSGVAHLGVGVLAIAILAGGHGATAQETIRVGESLTVADRSVTLVSVTNHREPRRDVVAARLLLNHRENRVESLEPELRWYREERTMLTSPNIRTGPVTEVYVTLLQADPIEGSVTIRMAVTPLVLWLWVGSGLLVAGGLIAYIPNSRTRAGVRKVGQAIGQSPAQTPNGQTEWRVGHSGRRHS